MTPTIEVRKVEASAAGRDLDHREAEADEDRGEERAAADPVDAADRPDQEGQRGDPPVVGGGRACAFPRARPEGDQAPSGMRTAAITR